MPFRRNPSHTGTGRKADSAADTATGGADTGRSAPAPPSGGSKRSRRRQLRWATLGSAVVLASFTSYCVQDALAAPGGGSPETKLAHWGRCHGLGSIVDLVDNRHQHSSAPLVCSARSGTVRHFAPTRPQSAATPTPTAPPISLHAPARPLVSPAEAGEGAFTPLVTEQGRAVIQSALVHPNAWDTGFPVRIVWIKQWALRFDLHPDVSEPDGSWTVPATIAPGHRDGLVAAFNGGFKVSNGDSHGGLYLDGKTIGTLRDGAASEVFHRDGSLTVGVWGRDVRMTPDVVGVRQCLVPLVLGGQVTDDALYGGIGTWGLTDGGNPAVARSRVGVDRNCDIVYVGGRLLTVQSLATLQRADAVTVMMLDINPSWPSFISFDASHSPHDPMPHNLVNFVRAPTRYRNQSAVHRASARW
jgi:hypothetical protein